MIEPVELKKIREFGEVIGDTFLFIKQNLKPLMKAIFYFCGLFVLAGCICYLIMQLQLSSLITDGLGPRRAQIGLLDMIRNFSFNYLVLIIFYVLSYTSFYVTILSYISLYVSKGNVAPNVEEVWAYFKYYFFRMMGSGLLMTLFMCLCFLCCIIPGFWVMPAVSLFYPILVLENASFSYSFSRSFNLLKDNWWITFATIIVIGIIGEACKWVVQFPAFIIAWASAFTHLENPITNTYAVVTSVAQFLSLIFMVIPIVGSALIYYNLVERKESLGLLGRIESLGQTSPTENSTPEEY